MNTSITRPKTQLVLTTRSIQTLKPCEETYKKAPVLIAINHRNQVDALATALASVEHQSLFIQKNIQVVVLDDHSDKNLVAQLRHIANRPYITILQANCGNASQARNALLDWADEQMFVKWVARLDADDVLATELSVAELVTLAEQKGASIALGGNQLVEAGCILDSENHPSQLWLDSPQQLIEFIHRFCHGLQKQELPSCNLLLANRTGFRYPNIKSAEDHWLVAMLLLLFPQQIAIDSKGIYCKYSLNGNTTLENRTSKTWVDSRHKLAFVTRALLNLKERNLPLLGYGMEGIVYEQDNTTVKVFHPWGMSDGEANRLNLLLSNKLLPIPNGHFKKQQGSWYFYSPRTNYKPVALTISYQKIKAFLCACYKAKVAPTNIKRDNLMFHPNGDLHYIDVGKDLKSLSSSYFIDLSARLYAIGVLGFSDYELARRPSSSTQENNLSELNGFDAFYLELISALHPLNEPRFPLVTSQTVAASTTLLIKACAQDGSGFYEQICHIVTQLEYPTNFAEKIIVVDLFEGPFLRQYAAPNLTNVLEQAAMLQENGIVDRVISAPTTVKSIQETYKKWFDRDDVLETQTSKNAPLYNQLWAFDQVKTPSVLQCDCDVLIGRKDWQHDFLQEMLDVLQQPDVQSVGFNIPKSTHDFLDYFGEPGQFAPEVRLGLLDLRKFNAALPLVNPVESGQFQLTWHRAMQRYEKQSGYLKSVRGGCPASFYVHPNNTDKPALDSGIIRDLIAQGKVPKIQQEAFDLVADAPWHYNTRDEKIIFLLKGRNTPDHKLQRCISSLVNQDDNTFGVIVIDDASSIAHSGRYSRLLEPLKDNVTLIRHAQHHGRMPNFISAVYNICTNLESLIVVLDQDDFLMNSQVVNKLKQARLQGHDVIQMPMFRPNKPLKLYQPDYQNSRSKEGANVWAHLRAFTKSSFLRIPLSAFKRENGEWFDSATDYVTMLALVELAESPTFIDGGYAYWHERDDYTREYKAHQKILLNELLQRPSLNG